MASWLRRRWRRTWNAPLFLAVASPVLAEILSGNLPPRVFVPLLPFLMLAYGVPVILIRDAWVRWGLGIPGLFALGLAYGFVNEALFAKTVFLNTNVPIDTFDGYAPGGFNAAWSAFIVPWHAMHSVLYPIAITWLMFPHEARRPFLDRKWSLILAGITLLVGILVHFAEDDKNHLVGSATTLLLSLALIAFFASLAWWLPRGPWLYAQVPRPGLYALGALAALSLFVFAILSDHHWSTAGIVLFAALWFPLLGAVVWWRGGFGFPGFLRFALVHELVFNAITTLFAVVRGVWDSVAAMLGLEWAFVALLLRLRSDERLFSQLPDGPAVKEPALPPPASR